MRVRAATLAVLVGLGLWMATPSGQTGPPPAPYVAGDVLVKFRRLATATRRQLVIAAIGARTLRRFDAIDLHHVRLPQRLSVEAGLASLRADADVIAAQPNYIRTVVAPAPPNDPGWAGDFLWGLQKIQAQPVWTTHTTGSNAVVVADLDSGIRYNHPDLNANVWVNPGEIAGNLMDDDLNGYVDDVVGIDTWNHDSNPLDDNGHGTHTAGTIGAVGNNGTGVVGVNWNVRILTCKFLNAAGNGSDAGAIECFNYLVMMKNRGVNIRVSNNSWGGLRGPGPFPQLLKDAIDAAGDAGILNVFAAGNGGADSIGDNNDLLPHDPSSFESPSIIAVAASDVADARGTFSNYGAVSVDLAAPGVGITSTYPPNAYATANGTSMATPHVAGAAALLLAMNPGVPMSGLRDLLLDSVDVLPPWNGVVATGGRLNVLSAATTLASNTPPSVALTSPSPGAVFAPPATIALAASASDNGAIVTVEFFANGVLIGSDQSSPYTFTWAAAPAGTYALTARATDNLGAATTSAAVSVSVTTTLPPSASFSATSVTFGKQLAGTTSAVQIVGVGNAGPGHLIFSSFNGAAPAAAFTVGSFQAATDCPLAPPGLAPGGSCAFSFRFSPLTAGAHASLLTIVSNDGASPHAIALAATGFVVDEATVLQAMAGGGTRVRDLQNADGGWYFRVDHTSCGAGPGVSCPNIVGQTGLGLLTTYERTDDPSLLAAATEAGDLIVQRYDAALLLTPPKLPTTQDLEMLAALTSLTGNTVYETTAQAWFQLVVNQYPVAADRVDAMLATRGNQGLRTLAAWDVASFIRSAKAAGQPDYALAAALRIRDREPDWKDVDPAHRFDQCGNPAGCGPADNRLAFDYTILGMGSLLWAFHDLPGFDADIDEYRAFLLAQQDPAGSWDVGDTQITAYATLGLAAVGGVGTDPAIRAAAAFLIANQLSGGGWPSYVIPPTAGGEYAVVDGEAIRALATLYSTPVGANVVVAPAQLSTVTFSAVASSGATTVVALDRSAATVPGGFAVVGGLTYEVQTTAVIGGAITVCFDVPWAVTTADFANVRILHGEQGALVDRTILSGPLAPDFAARRVCALVTSLSPFAVARRDPSVDTTPPQLAVTLSPAVLHRAHGQMVRITASVAVSDEMDPAPAVTLVSITSSDADASRRGRPRDIRGDRPGTDDRVFLLRAERDRHGEERVYTVVYRATDRSGNSADVTAHVVVPGVVRKR